MALTKAKTNIIDLDKDTNINGVRVGKGAASGPFNSNSTAVGLNCLASNTTGQSNTAVGFQALFYNTTGSNNTANGANALYNNTSSNNTAFGSNALGQNTTGNSNTAIGKNALQNHLTGFNNTAIGADALSLNSSASNNTAIGRSALVDNTTGTNNTAIGLSALQLNSSGNSNTAIGVAALQSSTNSNNTAVGGNSLLLNTSGINNTAIGIASLSNSTTDSNCSGIGNNAQVTGSNQVQLGNSSTTTFAYGAVQDRSDERDKADIRDTTLGLDFIKSLRPVDFKWDMREDYRTTAPDSVSKPASIDENATQEEKDAYQSELAAYNAYVVERDQWIESSKLQNITHDGSKTRNRYHHGLIAQEVKSVLDANNIDFGGFQDHSLKGGDDVLSIGYMELIAPLIKAIQELSLEVSSLKEQLNS